MTADPESIKAEIASTRAQIETVVDQIEQKIVLTKQEVRQRFSLKHFAYRHRFALAVPAVLFISGTWLAVVALRHTWPAKLYFGMKALGLIGRR